MYLNLNSYKTKQPTASKEFVLRYNFNKQKKMPRKLLLLKMKKLPRPTRHVAAYLPYIVMVDD